MFSNFKNNLRTKIVFPLLTSLVMLSSDGLNSQSTFNSLTSSSDALPLIVNTRPQIIQEFEFYENQIKENFPKIKNIISYLSSFDTFNSKGEVIFKQDLEKYVVALLTQESNFIQTKYDGSILSSWANAVGVSQFTNEGVKALNGYLHQKQDTVNKSLDDKIIAKHYKYFPDLSFDDLLKTDKLGVATGFYAATLLSKFQLQRHPDSWKFAAIEYNWGRTRKGDYSKVEHHLPKETRDYVKRIEQHMNVYADSTKSYTRYLVQRWGVVSIELENMFANNALKKKDTLQAFNRFNNALILNDYLVENNLDTIMRYQETILLHANYELANLKRVQGDTLGALENYSNVLSSTKKNKEKRYEYKNSELFLNRIKNSTKDSVIISSVDSLLK